jgi:hypothetical protein
MNILLLVFGLLAVPTLIAFTLIGVPGQWATAHGHHLLNDVMTVVLIITALLLVAYL